MNRLFVLILYFLSSYSSASSLEFIEISEWGYGDVKHSKYSEYYCLGDFKPVVREYRDIKSKKYSKELGDTFYRFTLIREAYRSPIDAEARLSNIEARKFPHSKASKSCTIRQAFLVGKTIYQVHSDVGVFWEEARALVKKLEQQINP